jgi:hypothetical protein
MASWFDWKRLEAMRPAQPRLAAMVATAMSVSGMMMTNSCRP